ncbi:CPBP family intramembrane glutamic endopeptidase [Halobacillus sp. Marseille-Q1614]|uniref:CPBP family intramembrane glutamic endopeptidase n=1 Tax=Halobacillus sp. Marseille-Q1614 TaxID=2709134 RepID=UPI001570A5E7|nr:type II CAAX endopeptidase family protein [Halobacillus sp. Marseille-Q1614]
MENKPLWKQTDPWTWKTFISLLLLEFLFVMIVVKYGIQELLEQWFDNSLYSGTLTGIVIAMVLITGVYFIALRPKQLKWNEVGVRAFPAKDWRRILLWTLLLMIGGFAVLTFISYFGHTSENSKTESLQQNLSLMTLLIGLISAAVISPIYEEIFYRGFLYRWLRTRVGMTWGILISSLIFTAAHYPTTNTMPINFMDGVVFAWAYERTNSIWPGVIVHGLVNGISILLVVG